MKIGFRFWNFLLTCYLLSFLIGCASTGSPSGGPRDKTPPSLVEEESAKNFSTNYIPEKIELVFNEWIELKNQQREILISPPFFKNPKITSRGKKITVEFPKEEQLREDATYTINFGKSIVDFTEGNAAEGFRFVFATGDKIDSLEFTGSIVDSREDKPVKDILVLLYDLVEDSVVVKEKPFYYARTDDGGNFKFENLKTDTFKLLVLEDLNFNYLLDPELERLAFPDSVFILNDSSSYSPKLRLFKPEQRMRILNSSSQTPGEISTVFNKEANEVDYYFLYPEGFDPLVELSKDTLIFWFEDKQDSVGVVYGSDTLDFTIKAFDSLFYSKKLSFIGSNASKTILAPFDSLKLSFASPLANVDTSLIRLIDQPIIKSNASKSDSTDLGVVFKDSLNLDSAIISIDTTLILKDSFQIITDSLEQIIDTSSAPIIIEKIDSLQIDTFDTILDSLSKDSTDVVIDTTLKEHEYDKHISLRDLYINSKWKEHADYRLELLPGALTDIYGRQNDSLILDFKTASMDEFGNIAINLSGLDSAQNYLVLLKLNDDIVKKTIVNDSTLNKIEHKRLRVNTYSIELIKDDDSNGKWTTGDYWAKRQPEEIKTFELEKLRENWDLEAEIFWHDSNGSVIDTSGISQDNTLLNLPRSGSQAKPQNPKPKKQGEKEVPNKKQKGKND